MADDGAARAAMDAAIERSGRALTEATAGRALCRIDGSGGPTPFFVKRAEGDLAALVDVRRRHRRDASERPLAAAKAVLGRWAADLDRWRERGSGPWIAYCEGGCAAVEALVDDLTAAEAPVAAVNSSAGTSADPVVP